jgi:hypothetical protein
MSGKQGMPAYTPKDTQGSDNIQGGYHPTTGQETTKPPALVPNQPSSVEPPKK